MYADCYVIPIPKKNVAAYKKMARLGAKTWKKYGAVDYAETIADDLSMPFGGISWAKAAKCKPGETVVVAWVTYKSKAHRNQVNAKVHAEFAKQEQPTKMPFDPKRFSFGGFKALVTA
jgi:uncharacterized protein YbaA (DUF1428 family)